VVTTTLLNWTVGLGLAIMTLLFIFRIVLTWYPQVELTRFPWLLIFWPTEPLLVPVRKWVPPIGGVEIAPVIWVGLITLLRELLVGQQGLLRMLG
jgi:YggT family protein